MGQFPLEQWFYEMPVCTRWWTVATVATAFLVQCHIITPFALFYSFRAVFVKNQVQHTVSGGFLLELHKQLTHPSSIVLAPPDYLPLLRSFVPRPSLPRLLPPTVLPLTRRIIRPITSAFLMAPPVCHIDPALPESNAFYALSRVRAK